MSLRLHRAHLFVPILALCLACVSAGCGSTVASSTSPSPAKCGVAVTAPAASIDPAGAPATVAVSTQAECTWSASSEANWITGLTPASGQGTGEVKVNVAPNPAASARQGDVVVNGVRAQIRQEAAPCRFDLSAGDQSFSASGGTARINVTTLAGCAWTARTDTSWATVTSGSTGTGSGTITIAVATNNGGARNASLVVADRTVRISQEEKVVVPPVLTPPTACVYTVAPSVTSVGAGGGSGSTITIDTTEGCEWGASSNAGWLTITSDTHSFGPASVMFSAVANTTGTQRTGTLSIAGRVVTVTQAAASTPTTPPSTPPTTPPSTPPPTSCAYVVAPTTLSLPSSGSTRSSFTVTTTSTCSWTAGGPSASWITITSGASGSGNGTVNISAAANTTTSLRNATMTIAGQEVTITEAAASCSFTVAPASATIGAGGGTGTPIVVTNTSGCGWSTTGVPTWITLTSGQSGTGGGTVTYTVQPNTGAQRSATLTVAGQPVTITQNACTFTISPTSQSFEKEGGNGGPVTVTTQSACSWTAATGGANWITITNGSSGTGSGNVRFTVDANSGAARTATLTIAGQPFTVTQQKK